MKPIIKSTVIESTVDEKSVEEIDVYVLWARDLVILRFVITGFTGFKEKI